MKSIKSKKIIFIHGLNSKPPKEKLFKFWKQCLLKNLELSNNSLKIEEDIFSMVYWANEIPNHLEDKEDDVKNTQKSINDMLALRVQLGNNIHNNLKDKIGGLFKDMAVDVASMLTGALTIKDNVLENYLQEINYYQNDQYIADNIRKHLEKEITAAWNENHEIAIISHSMGTFIAYDVLWRLSRKNLEKYKSYHDKKVPLFITMGSPLGENAIKNLLFGEAHEDERRFPSNIQKWYNFSAIGDIVSHDSTLKDDFHLTMKDRYRLLEDNKDYVYLQNIYKNSKGKLNPHKSYGYLIQPKLAKVLIEFLES